MTVGGPATALPAQPKPALLTPVPFTTAPTPLTPVPFTTAPAPLTSTPVAPGHSTPVPVGFAPPKESTAAVVGDAKAADRFLHDFVRREAKFYEIARDPDTKLTFDGIQVDGAGQPNARRHWSAASKESLDIGIAIKALEGNSLAAEYTAGGDIKLARAKAANLLNVKMDSYLKFNKANPGYGGMLPWFYSGKTITPTPDWQGKVPGLDNGEWLWSMMTAEHSLRRNGFVEVADRYRSYLDITSTSVVPMFYDAGAGKVRGDVDVVDPKSLHSAYRTMGDDSPTSKYMTYLSGDHGIHEGAMMVHYVTMFGKGLPKEAPDRIWSDIKMQRVEHKAGSTWQAYWGSAHESWAYLFMPFRDDTRYADLFRIREQIRSQNAVARGYAGFATSTNDPRTGGYLDGAGIEGISKMAIRNNDTYAAYGAFPALLQHVGTGTAATADGRVALGWLANMLHGPKMYGPLGGGESATNDGTATALMKTIDGSFPLLLSMMGGLEQETADMLRSTGTYDAFRKRIAGEYDEAFGAAPLRETGGFVAPTVAPLNSAP